MPSAQYPRQIENFVNASKKLLKNTNYTFPVVRCFTWKLELVSNILWLAVASLQGSQWPLGWTKNKKRSD